MRKSWLFLTLLLTVVSGVPLPASAAGALAAGVIPDGRFAWAVRDRTDNASMSAAELEAAAIAECKRLAITTKASGETCKVVLRYDDQCAAVAASVPSGHRIGWGKALAIEVARREALAMCTEGARAIGETCDILSAFCDR